MSGRASAVADLRDTATARVVSAVAGAVASSGPQARFDDLHSAVYRILHDAKASHHLVKPYKGSHTSPLPHPLVTEAGGHLLLHRRGLFSYTSHRVLTVPHATGGPAACWDTYDRFHEPRVSVSEALRLLEGAGRRVGESLTDHAAYITGRHHDLGHYRGGSTGYDDETRAFLAAHFTGQGIPAHPDEVLIFCGGAKGAFIAVCASLMCTHAYDRLRHRGGLVLAPQGYYQSLRLNTGHLRRRHHRHRPAHPRLRPRLARRHHQRFRPDRVRAAGQQRHRRGTRPATCDRVRIGIGIGIDDRARRPGLHHPNRRHAVTAPDVQHYEVEFAGDPVPALVVRGECVRSEGSRSDLVHREG